MCNKLAPSIGPAWPPGLIHRIYFYFFLCTLGLHVTMTVLFIMHSCFVLMNQWIWYKINLTY